MGNEAVIKCENVWKRYGLHPLLELKEWLAEKNNKPISHGDHNGPWALKDISFSINEGEIVGIIGKNGAGKSTLLKLIAGVSKSTGGKIKTRGKIFSMIELNAGISPDLTGRENAKILGSIMGMGRKEVARKIDEIEEYCELGEWFDMPVRKYSSGMKARLGFSVAMNVDADILLIDEVLAVGDLSFQKKCYNSLENLRAKGVTIVFVSHNIRQVERLCSRVIYLSNGKIIKDGESAEICQLFFENSTNDSLDKTESQNIVNSTWNNSGEIKIKKAVILDENDEEIENIEAFSNLRIRIYYKCSKPIDAPNIGISILSSEMILLACLVTSDGEIDGLCLSDEGWVETTIPKINLVSGIYSISLKIKAANDMTLGEWHNLTQFGITFHPDFKASSMAGIVHLPRIWKTSDGKIVEKLLK